MKFVREKSESIEVQKSTNVNAHNMFVQMSMRKKENFEGYNENSFR